MFWDSNWDKLNSYKIGAAAATALGLDGTCTPSGGNNDTGNGSTDDSEDEDNQDTGTGNNDQGNTNTGKQTSGIKSVYWCGFSSQYCGQSLSNDVSSDVTHVIIAYANFLSTGEVYTGTMPTSYISTWKNQGKKVLISVGGRSGTWTNIFASSSTQSKFVSTLAQVVEDYNLDGIDLSIETYYQTPAQLLSLLEDIKQRLASSKIVMVTLDNITVYPLSVLPVPTLNQAYIVWNYFVPVIQKNPSAFDYV